VETDFGEATFESLRRRGYLIAETGRLDQRMGHAHAICVQPDGSLTAGSDPRSDGESLVVALPHAQAGVREKGR
jgi:gamma-glutamyltranspeptidase/glutathione hydrolase